MAEKTTVGPPRSFRAVRKAMHRAARGFMAALPDRFSQKMPTVPVPIDDIVRRHQKPLVARARHQAMNNDYMRAFLRMARQNVVGSRGVTLQAQARMANGRLSQRENDAIEAAWHRWTRKGRCEVTGRHSFRMMLHGAVATAARDGEIMIRLVYAADASEDGFAVQVLDPQRCPVDHDQDNMRDGAYIRSGIEYNRWGRPVAYLFTTLDTSEANYHYGAKAFVRVPATEIIHAFVEDFPGQRRGLPWVATSLWRMGQLTEFENASLVNARESANKQGFLEWEEGHGPDPDDDEEVLIESEAGTYHELPAGLRFKAHDPTYPSGEFAVFHKAMLRGVASGMGVAYNNLATDLEGVNFSSIRQGTLDEREHWKDLQEWLIESVVHPIYLAWLRQALLRGRIVVGNTPARPDRFDRFSRVAWQGRRWDWIDPGKDVRAAIEAKNNLFTSPGQIIRERGHDPQTVWREIAADIDAMRDAGIPEAIINSLISTGGGNDRPQDAGSAGAAGAANGTGDD
ncbi:phage portal protein [Meridianimarinicoccus sp. RP-17]|uniref:phage portal protein n=1 Tax=Meridianimarinicoccus zhengii TaxID=2056810 RepID=UPI000DAC801B|nr:phage portal protein [Phycocomes zhengii]